MKEEIKQVEDAFTLARMKMVELQPNNEQALLKLIELKAKIIKLLQENGDRGSNKK